MGFQAARPKVLIVDHAWPSIAVEEQVLAAAGIDVIAASDDADEAALRALAADVDGIMVNWRSLPDDLLRAAPRCRVVARYGVGVDNIPVDLATALGIVVVNVPDFCTDELADHTMALLLSAARRIVPQVADVRAGQWGLTRARGLPRLSEQTLGLIGFGRSAQAVARRAQGFGLGVVAYSPSLARGEADRVGAVSLARTVDEVLDVADYVSLHLPAGPATDGLIGEQALRRMRSTAYLINTSRGSLVDQRALHEAVRGGSIAGAALDVLAAEPPLPDEPLIGTDGVLVTPHVAFYSEAAIAELQETAARNVVDVLAGRVPESVINAAVVNAPQRRR